MVDDIERAIAAREAELSSDQYLAGLAALLGANEGDQRFQEIEQELRRRLGPPEQ